jgi:hypothetical protein
MTLNKDWCYAEYNLCRVSPMPSVSNKPVMLSVVRLSVVILSVVASGSAYDVIKKF